MKLLTCASYYGTGSSAVTNLIDECDNVHDMGDYEFRFVQDPDGICDLEYNLVLNNHRHNSCFALKRFEKKVDFLAGNKFIKKYNRFFGDNWKILSKEYINNLIDAEYKGYWHEDLIAKGKFAYFIERTVNKIYHMFARKSERNLDIVMRNYTNYVTNPGDKFYSATKEYIDKLFMSANKSNKEFVMADQLVPPTNTMRYLQYFNDLKVVCVERDPRDLYLLEKRIWKGSIVPKDVQDFCIWYKATRAHRENEKDDPTKILRVQFEDMIYDYENTKNKILDFCGIDAEHHTKKKTIFNPEISIKNTKVFERFDDEKENIKYIEQELAKYLYKF